MAGLAGLGAATGGLALAVAPPAGAAPIFTQVWDVPLNDTGSPIAQSSPNVATLDAGGPSVVVGDRAGRVYALHLNNGSEPSGWPVTAGGPVDSTPSVAATSGGLDSVYVGSGNAVTNSDVGGYQAFGPSGTQEWGASVTDPASDDDPAQGVQASLTFGGLQGVGAVVAGSLDQEEYALNASSGATLTGWPFFTSDSVFSTAALADLYGTGQNEIIEGGAQTAGMALGQQYTQGGHLRILNDSGGLICHADTNQTVDSSPAVGGFLAGGATGIVVGTGSFFAGASDTDTVKAFTTTCGVAWSTTLDGSTDGSPALADVLGNGQLQVVEGTDTGTGGSVWVLNAQTGQPLWHQSVPGRVIGSITTADLGGGHQDLLVPTTPPAGGAAAGVLVLDGVTGATIAQLGNAPANNPTCPLGFQNSPLVTDDGGQIGITVAGYNCANQGEVLQYTVSGTNGSLADEAGAWPMFHHDPQLTGNAGGTPAQGSVANCTIPAAARSGYNLVATDGGIFSFGGQPFCGSTGAMTLNQPIVGMAMASNTGGYWLVASDGGVFAFGSAQFYGSMGGQPLNKPIVGIAATPDGKGYWLVASDGGIFAFGDARFLGSTGSLALRAPVVGISPTADGLGYRLVASDGGVFTFGDAQYFGSMGGKPLNKPIVGMALDVATAGYWLVASDGGIFAFGAPFYGSTGATTLNQPIVGMQSLLNGAGYRFVAADGGIFAFGAAPFYGSMGGQHLNRPVVAMAGF